MNYINEIKGNLAFWQKILGAEICNHILENGVDNCSIEEDKTKESFLIPLIEPYYRRALTEKIEEEKVLLRDGSFLGFFRVFIKSAYFYWSTLNLGLLNHAWRDIAENLYKRIEKIPLRVLIQDIHECKKRGLLIGKNSEEEYEDYEKKFLEDPLYIESLCENYSEMKRLLFLQIYQTINFMWEVEKALQKDKDVLVKQLCKEHNFEHILHMDTGLADCHKSGKTVTKLVLDNGYILIYKPHNMQKELLFEEIYEKFLNWCGLSGRRLHIVDRGTYGWEEYIERVDCNSNEGVEGYFQRTGVLLFLCYVMGATDIHGENLMAFGEYPILLDLETFPGCRQQKKAVNADQMVRDRIASSVLCTGLLPVMTWGERNAGVIVSALHKNSKEMTPFRLPLVCRPNSSEIHIEYKSIEIRISGSIPVFQNNEMNPAEFEKWICKGFEDAYDCMLERKQQILDELESFFSYEGRVLLRHTQQYSMNLNMSLFPEFLKVREKRELFLYVIDKQNNQTLVHPYERRSLSQMDVPIFFVDGKGRDLLNGDDERYSKFFAKTPYEIWRKKTKRLNQKDKKEQLRFIKLSLALLKDRGEYDKNDGWGNDQKVIISKENLLWKIADIVCGMAVVYGEDEDVNWSGLRFYDEKSWSFAPHGMYLYDGIGGIAVFLAMVLTRYSEDAFERIYKMVTKKLFLYTERLLKDASKAESAHAGAFIGEGSVVHTYLLLYQITKRQAYLDYAKLHGKVLLKKLNVEESTDFLSGLAGAVVVLLKLYKMTKEDCYLKVAIELGEHIWGQAVQQEIGYGFSDSMQGKALAGLAHGNSGYILAYSYLLEATGDSRYVKRICALLAYEDSLYSEERSNWRDLRNEDLVGKDLNVWCHGAAGILLSRMRLKRIKEFREHVGVQEDMKRCVKALRLYSGTESICLCHGMAGMCWILGHYLKEYSDNGLEKKREELLKQICLRVEKREGMSPQEYCQVSLMTGITGVGVVLCEGKDWEMLC